MLPHDNLVETVLKSALAQSGVLALISLLPAQLHSAALSAYAPSIIRCNSLRLPHCEHYADASLSAVVAALSFRSLTCLELYHVHASALVGPSDGLCAVPSELQLPDTCIFRETDPRRNWERMQDTWVYSQVDRLVMDLLLVTKTFSNLRSLTLTCTVVGTRVTETLSDAFAAGRLPQLTRLGIQNCSPDLNAPASARNRLTRSFQVLGRLEDALRGQPPKDGFTMQCLPTVPGAVALALCEGYSHQLRCPESYRSEKFTLKVVVCKGSLKSLHMYECNVTVRTMQALSAIIAQSPHLEAIHVCQPVMVFIREPLLQGLAAQLTAAATQPVAVDALPAPSLLSQQQRCAGADQLSADTQYTRISDVASTSSVSTCPTAKRLRLSVPGGSLKELHMLGHEYNPSLDPEALLQRMGAVLDGSSKVPAELRDEQGEEVQHLLRAQSVSSELLQQVITGNPQLVSLRLDSWDEDEKPSNKSRFVLSDKVLESLSTLSCLQCLGLNLPALDEAAGKAIVKAISPDLRMLVMHLDHDGTACDEQQFMQQLAPSLAAATTLTSIELPRATPHACSCDPLLSALSHLTGLKRLRLACIGDAWVPEDPYQPHHLHSLAKAVQQMPHMLQLELPLLSACDRSSLQALMSAVAQCSHLESLEMEACTDIQALEAVAPALQSITTLRHLKLAHCKFGDAPSHGPSLASSLSCLKRLECLVLKTSWIPDSMAQAMQESVTNLPCLRSLDIRCPPRAALGFAQDIALSMYRLCELVSLQIQSVTVTIDALVESLPQMTCLQDLFLTLPHQLRFDNMHRLLMAMRGVPLTMLSLDYLQGCETSLQAAHVAYTLKELPCLMHVVLTAYVPLKSQHKNVKEGWCAVAGQIRCWFLLLVDGT